MPFRQLGVSNCGLSETGRVPSMSVKPYFSASSAATATTLSTFLTP